MERGRSRHRRATSCGVRPAGASRSSSRAASGTSASSSSGVASRSRASARANRWAQRSETASGTTPSTVPAPLTARVIRDRGPGLTWTTAPHSTGSRVPSVSRQRKCTPASGPSRSRPETPGRARSRCTPSSRTTYRGPSHLSRPLPRIADRVRTRAVSSATRRCTWSLSGRRSPTRLRHPPADSDRVCGRCATQVQSRPVPAPAHSSPSDTSCGLCQPQTWATRARATPSASSRGPAMPRTPTEASGTATGTRSRSRDVRCGSRAASVTVVSEATVPVPTDSERKSSSTRRRSHSRESGAVTVLSSSAWSGWRSLRRSRSSRSATSRACSAAARATAWSATLRAQPALPSRRSLAQLPSQHERAHQAEQQHGGAVQDPPHHHGESQRQRRGDHGQPRSLTAGRRCRQPDVGDRGRGVDARPAVDAEMAGPVGVGRRELAEGVRSTSVDEPIRRWRLPREGTRRRCPAVSRRARCRWSSRDLARAPRPWSPAARRAPVTGHGPRPGRWPPRPGRPGVCLVTGGTRSRSRGRRRRAPRAGRVLLLTIRSRVGRG